MLLRMQTPWRRRVLAGASLLLGVAMVGFAFRAALALREGSEGKEPVNDPGWPKGAAALFNHSARIAYWNGGLGGEYTAEFRGDSKVFNAVLADFAKLEIKTKRLIIHDGVGTSYWISATRKADDPTKKEAEKMDWSLMLWSSGEWQRRRELSRTGFMTPDQAQAEAPTEINVYTGGNIKWADITVPEGLTIDDQRMSSHGFSLEDGNVLEGKVIDLATKRPLAARVRLQRLDYKKDGELSYAYVSGTVADEKGHWVLTNVPPATYQVIVEQEGYVMRIAAWHQLKEEPRWHACDTGLSRPGPISGRVVDEAGAPLADAEVRIGAVVVEGSGAYDCANDRTTTDADGRFQIDRIAQGTATLRVHKTGYIQPGWGEGITTPKAGIAVTMKKAGRTIITVDYSKLPAKPPGYSIHMEPEGGQAVGRWSGDGTMGEKNEMVWENIPPGKYVIWGRPNPGADREKSDPITVELKGGETNEVKVVAKFVPPPPPEPQFKPKPPPKSTDAF